MKIERILVPTDFSEHSLAASKYAIELAREHESEVVLVHVVEPLPYGVARWYEPTKLLEHYGETASVELKRFENEDAALPKIPFRTPLRRRSRSHRGAGEQAQG